MIRQRQNGNVSQPLVVVRKKKPTASSQAQAKPATSQSETLRLQPNRRQRKAQAPRVLLEVLRARWPAVFPHDPRKVRPLMRGVHRDIAQRLPGTGLWLVKRAIILFQRLSGGGYWRAVLKGGPRYALDGSPYGEVTPREQEHARQTLTLLARRREAISFQ
jgi:sRNA-binding protein